ncbi:hypothetical protein [Streptomyces sp. NPDC008312]|uniref:hypothetical protein n=1 Tax=Streptomyces sp. NPDC008312 TaxID=3364825 RepID=UPI0036EE1E4D
MTRWGGPFARRRAGRSSAPAGRRPADLRTADDRPDGTAAEGLLVEDHDGLLLLRTPSDNALTPADVADLSRGMRTDDGTVTVIAGADGMESSAFWPRLSELLDSLSESGADTVRLVMAGAGQDIKDRPATARRIADAWGVAVKAPDGAPLVVPGGSLFVPPAPSSDGKPPAGGWWRFAPGADPEPLGPRSPEPSWQPALRHVPSDTSGGSVVEQIPAGLLVRPAEATATQPGDLYHAVPVDPRRPAVVIGVPYGEDVSAEEVAEVLTALPEEVRSGVRLAPGGQYDVLRLAQAVSDRLDADVEVMTGLPLVAAAGPLGAYSVRSVLAAPDGTPKWLPFVDAVVCRPPDEEGRARPPQLLRWTPPLPGSVRPEEGVIGLTDRWQVTVTRAGLWVGPRGGPRLSPTARQVDANGPVIELGMPGELMDASLMPALSSLLGALTPALRERATLHVHGVSHDGGHGLRRLAAQHGLRTLRYAAPASAPARARPTAQAQARPPGPPARTAASVPPLPAASAGTGAAATGRPESVPGPRTQSAQPRLPGRPAQPGPSRPGQQGHSAQPGRPSLPLRLPRPSQPAQPDRTGPGYGPGRPAEGGARAERARQLREAMGLETAADASAPARAGAPGRPPGSGAAEEPDGPWTSGASGASGAPAAVPGRAADFVRAGAPDAAGGPAAAEGPPVRPDGGDPAEGMRTAEGAGTDDAPAGAGGPERADDPTRADASVSGDRSDAADGPEAEGRPESADGSGPSATRGPAAGPAGGPRPGETEAPGSPDVVPRPEPDIVSPPKPVRVASGAPGDPAPAIPTSPGAMASRDVKPDVPAALAGPGGTGTADDGAGEADGAAGAAGSPGAPPAPDAPQTIATPDTPDTREATPDSDADASNAADASDAAGTGDAADAGDAVDVPQAPLPPVPFDLGHRSSEVERTAFRALADGMWDRHGAAVARSLARMPALRGKEQEAARADLIALRMYLHISEGPLSHGAVTRALREYEPDMLPYGACVASALNRLPSYRGAVLRGMGSDPTAEGSGAPALPRPGTLLRDAALLSTTPLDSARTATPPGGSYVIWSVAGRRVRQLSDHGRGPDEVVFAPGTLFRVLDVRRDGPAVQIYLRELTGPATATKPDPDVDRAVLARLDDVVRGRSTAPAGTGHWPERCVGAVGAGP